MEMPLLVIMSLVLALAAAFVVWQCSKAADVPKRGIFRRSGIVFLLCAAFFNGLFINIAFFSAPARPPSAVSSRAPEVSLPPAELPVIDYAEVLRNSKEYDGQEVRVSGRITKLDSHRHLYFSDRLGFLKYSERFDVDLSRRFSYGTDISDYYELGQYVLVQGVWSDGLKYLSNARVIADGEEAMQAEQAFMDEWTRGMQADSELPLTDYMDLTEFPDRYVGQRVRTVGKIQKVSGSAAKGNMSIYFPNRIYRIGDASFDLWGCPPEMQSSCTEGEYVVLSCLVTRGHWGNLWFSECFIERVGDEAKELSQQADHDWWARFFAEREDYISACQPYTYDDLARYPDAYRGKQAVLSGTVLKMSEGLLTDTVYLDMGQNCVVCIKYSGKLPGDPEILKGDQITFYGECDGKGLYEPLLEESEWVPRINARYSSFNQLDAP